MSTVKEITFIGRNIQFSLLAVKAAAMGINVNMMLEINKDLFADDEPFILFNQQLTKGIIHHFKQKRNIKFLKKIAPHLLLSSHVEQFLSLSLYLRILISLNNIFSTQKINIIRSKEHKGIYCLSYASYKLSTARLSIELLKSINESNLKIKHYDKLYAVNWINRQGYELEFINEENNKRKILTKSILTDDINLRFNQKHRDFEYVYIFTYPLEKLKIDSNILIEAGETIVKIIIWFEWVYFEIKGPLSKDFELKRFTEFLKMYLPRIEIKGEEIAFKNYFKKNIPQDHNFKKKLLYLFDNKSHKLNSGCINSWQKGSQKIIHKLLKHLGIINATNIEWKNPQITGSNFQFPYHPLRIMEYCDEKYDEAKQILKSSQYFKKLFYRYGTQIEDITNLAFEYWNQTKNIKKAWLLAEIDFAINNEYCTSPVEFMYWRTEEWMAGENGNTEIIKNAFDDLLKEG